MLTLSVGVFTFLRPNIRRDLRIRLCQVYYRTMAIANAKNMRLRSRQLEQKMMPGCSHGFTNQLVSLRRVQESGPEPGGSKTGGGWPGAMCGTRRIVLEAEGDAASHFELVRILGIANDIASPEWIAPPTF